jgi:hypothetical protein
MSQHFRFDASRSLTSLEQDSTIVAVIEMCQTKWLVAALVPGVERQPLKKFYAQEEMLLNLAVGAAKPAGLGATSSVSSSALRLAATGSGSRAGCGRAMLRPTSSIPPASAVSHEHRRAKTDRLDTELLMRVFLGWRAAKSAIAAWWRSRRSRRRTRGDQTVSARIWSLSKRGLSTRSRRYLPASAFALCARPCASLPKGSEICARRKARRCHRTRFRNCAAISRGYPSYATRSAWSNRNVCASSRWLLLPRRIARTR